ncbi:MAG: HNH endonuclease [Pseudomonas capeferrum]|uniref:HNH endonuclease n=1 Tax=Pseudomonas capeferrum TaxID=1495066 RepID=UPI003D0E2D79
MHQDADVHAYGLGDKDLHFLFSTERLFVGPPRPARRGKLAPTPEDLIERPDAPRHLYALDADDLLEFTANDILDAWSFRDLCCGSKEAASELYALYRVLNGDDECYAGTAAYLDHPAVMVIFPENEVQAVQVGDTFTEAVVEGLPVVESEPKAEMALSLADVRELTAEQLMTAWANRPESFASLEAAAETLAILRSLNSTDTQKPSFEAMMDHDLVQDLLDTLPLELEPVLVCPTVELGLLRADQRTVRARATVVRPQQGNFRSALFLRYGGACCITGCKVDTLLEAAHIIPYRGDQTDDVTNGLLLRVDLHRLFDAHLVTINPNTLAVEVASTIEDTEYREYHGKCLFKFSPKPRILFLETHYVRFKNATNPIV